MTFKIQYTVIMPQSQWQFKGNPRNIFNEIQYKSLNNTVSTSHMWYDFGSDTK